MTPDEKVEVIRRVALDFTVISEVGAKSSTDRLPCHEWAVEVSADLDAGATWVLTEGRESGTVGVYDDDGAVRQDIVECVVEAAGIERVVFEAPHKDQQAWFIKRFGANVNLANIPMTEVSGLETLRLGLRADTVNLDFPAPVSIADNHR
jgi:phosphosulfolactate synthase